MLKFSALLAGLLLAIPAYGQVTTPDPATVVSSTETTVTEGITFPHEVTPGTSLLLVSVTLHAGEIIGSISWAGAPMVLIADIDDSTSSAHMKLEVWGLLSPSPATGDVVVSMDTGFLNNAHIASALNFAGTSSDLGTVGLLAQDFNNDVATNTCGQLGGPTGDGNAAVVIGSARGDDMQPATSDAGFAEEVDRQTGGGSSVGGDHAQYLAIDLDGAPDVSINWGAIDANVCGLFEIEADVAGEPSFTVVPTVQNTTNTSYTLSYTSDSEATFFAVACNPGESAPNAAQVKAGECGTGAAEAFVSEAVTGADTSVLSGIMFPRHDIYSVLGNIDGDSVVAPLTNEERGAEDGQELILLTAVSGTSPFSDTAYFSPDVAPGDVIEADSVTSPGGFAITWQTDGDFSYTDPSGSRQSIDFCIQDTSDTTGEFSNPACWAADDTIWVNNAPPICDEGSTVILTQDAAMESIDLNTFCTDGDADSLTYAVSSGALPAGVTLADGIVSGVPETEGESTVVFTSTDLPGEQDTITFDFFVVAATSIVLECRQVQ